MCSDEVDNQLMISKLLHLVSLFPFVLYSSEYTIVSWNISNFGQSRDDTEIELIADLLNDADIIAIQEVVAKDPGGAKAVARLVEELNRKGSSWDYRISHPTASRSSHVSERYAFIWRRSKFQVTGGRPFLVSELASLVDREPFVIQLSPKDSEAELTLINFHACTHKKHFPERQEIKHVSDWILRQGYSDPILMGDMNLVIDDKAFHKLLRNGYESVLHGDKTSLKTKCKDGVYLLRSEDNVLCKLKDFDFIKGKAIDFIKGSNCEEVAWKRVSYSDHLPVEFKISKDEN